MSRYGADIFWLDDAPPPPPPRRVAGAAQADVAIIGGGYTGLWTALHLREADPSLKIIVLEAEEIGFGASGRNGGFAMCLLDFSLAHLLRHHGAEHARNAHLAVERTIDDMGEFVARHGIDCDWVKGGLMMVATNRGQEERLEADLDAARALGLETVHALTREETLARVNSPTYRRGVWEEACAVVQPAKLVRGLARVAIEQGIDIYQDSPASGWMQTTDGMRVTTPSGYVDAAKVVLATNAWARYSAELRKKLRPLYTYIILTEPLSDEQWAQIGWEQREGIEDKRNYVHYYRRTADGRISWGGATAPYYGGIAPRHDSSERVFKMLERTFAETFPQIGAVAFTHRWGGPVGITAQFLPMFGSLAEGRFHYGVGYNGHGVAPSHVGGRILRDLVLGRDSEYTNLVFANGKQPAFPPEPLMRLGEALTRRSLLRQDRRFDKGASGGLTDPRLLRVVNKLG